MNIRELVLDTIMEIDGNGVPSHVAVKNLLDRYAELEKQKCGWWIDVGVEPLAVALKGRPVHSKKKASVSEWKALVEKMGGTIQ